MSKIPTSRVGRLNAYAQVFTCSRVIWRPAVRSLLDDAATGEGAPTELEMLRDLHNKLTSLPEPPAGPRLDMPRGMSEFAQLTPRQRAAAFLVIGLEYPFEAAAFVMARKPAQVQLEVISALFMLEHVLPLRRTLSPKARARANTGRPAGGSQVVQIPFRIGSHDRTSLFRQPARNGRTEYIPAFDVVNCRA